MAPMVTRLCVVLSCLLVASLGGCGGGSSATGSPDASAVTGGIVSSAGTGGGPGGVGGGGGGTGGQPARATNATPPLCIPGANVACACVTGQTGAQTCTSAGTFAACVCVAPTVDGGGLYGAEEPDTRPATPPPLPDSGQTSSREAGPESGPEAQPEVGSEAGPVVPPLSFPNCFYRLQMVEVMKAGTYCGRYPQLGPQGTISCYTGCTVESTVGNVLTPYPDSPFDANAAGYCMCNVDNYATSGSTLNRDGLCFANATTCVDLCPTW